MLFETLTVLTASLAMPAAAPAAAAPVADHVHDFDFFAGKWRVHHWQLAKRLAGNHDWVEFDGTCQAWLTMDGSGNVDDNYLAKPSGAYRAMSIRAYDPKKQTWAIWWLDARNPHRIEPPVMGRFENGVGTFMGDDLFDGKPIKVRFIWSDITANSGRWEQAFSPDGGKTWETNWRMRFTRVE